MADKDKKNASPHKIPRWSISTDGGILGIFLVFGAIVAGGLICFYGSKEFEFTRVVFLALVVVAGACGLTLVVRWSSNLRKISEWLIFTEKGRFLIFLVAEAIVVGVFFCFLIGESKNLEFTRTLILALAAVGGGYGLILAAIRSVKLSEQVKIGQKQADTGQKQLFNQQLAQGATLLADKEMPIRRTGIRVLEDLAETTIGEPKQAQLIMRTIHDFVHANAYPSSGAEERSGDEERLDITLGIRTLVSLYKKSGQKTELKKRVQFQGCYLAGLNFRDAKLEGANFRDAQLQWANFIGAELQRANFRDAKLEGANFRDAQLQWANFIGAELQEADFIGAELQRANFNSAELQGANFRGAELQGANFRGAELQGADFMGAKLEGANFMGAELQGADLGDAQLQWADCTLADFSNAENLKEDQIKGMIFHAENHPTLSKDLERFLDKRRSYEFKEDPDDKSNLRSFIESDAEWSEKDVDEWFREYITSIRDSENDG